MLYIPGSDPRKLRKVAEFQTTTLILDLEDSVADSAKASARSLVASMLASYPDRSLWVRVNTSAPELLYDDLHAVVRPGLAGIVLPKVERAQDVQVATWVIGVLEGKVGVEAGSVRIIATIETANGLSELQAIATSSERLYCLGFGAGDFSRDLGLDWLSPASEPVLAAARSALVIASRRAGLARPHDGAFPRYRDADGLRLEAAAARALGFGGKHAVHPDQVAVIDEIFAPSEAEIERAREIIARFEEQEADGVGSIGAGGEMIDAPVVARARELIDTVRSVDQQRASLPGIARSAEH
jgi:citrate lyase beta subunit